VRSLTNGLRSFRSRVSASENGRSVNLDTPSNVAYRLHDFGKPFVNVSLQVDELPIDGLDVHGLSLSFFGLGIHVGRE